MDEQSGESEEREVMVKGIVKWRNWWYQNQVDEEMKGADIAQRTQTSTQTELRAIAGQSRHARLFKTLYNKTTAKIPHTLLRLDFRFCAIVP